MKTLYEDTVCPQFVDKFLDYFIKAFIFRRMSRLAKEENNNFILHVLRSEFVERCRTNPNYSLRAYARYLSVDQSLLSKILRGERVISKRNASAFCAKLGLNPSRLSWHNDKEQFTPLADDQINFISEWYHFAILEIIKTNSFKSDEKWLAKRLGLNVEVVRTAVQRLQRLKLIEIDGGKWRVLSANNSWTNNEYTTEARRRLQRDFLKMSLDAVESIPFAERDNGSLTIAIDKKRLPEFKEKLKQIRHELNDYFQADGEFDEVYQLTMSFFPLSKTNKGRE